MSMIRKITTEKKSTSSGDLLLGLMPYWPLFVLLICLAAGGAWLFIQHATPQYETHARILIKDEKKGVQDAKALEAFDMLTPKTSVDNELEVLKSKTLLNEVVDKLQLYAPVFEKGPLRDYSAYTTSPVTVMADSASGYWPVEKQPFTVNKSTVTMGKTQYPMNTWVNTPLGHLKFVKNVHQKAISKSGDFYFSLIDRKSAANRLGGRISVDAASKMSSIVDLTVTDEVPDRGEAILNGLIDAYNISQVARHDNLAANTLQFLNSRLKNVQDQLQSTEQKQQHYRTDRGAIDVSTQGKLYLENVASNDQKVSEINMQLSMLDQLENYVKSKDMNKGIVPSTIGLTDPGLTAMVKNIYELQNEMESLKKTAGENNPMVIADKDKIDKIRPQIIENVQNQRQSLIASKRNISATNGTYASTLESLPETERTLVDISREQNIQNGLYTYLLQKKEETALSFISDMPGSQVIDRAETDDLPVSPKKNVIYTVAVVLAVLIGLGMVGAKESFNGKVMFRKDIEDATVLPVIGEIASNRTKEQVVVGNRQRTLIAEQFRRLRTTLYYQGVGDDKKRVMVTSAISGEGKSFISINLAMSLALTGKRVVLLDFDLNKPSLTKKLNLADGAGVSEYLNGEATVQEIIRPVDLDPNLFVISSGSLPDNPSELLMNGKAASLLDELDQYFDMIVVDIAPVGPVSDAYIISPLCDATLYVVRHAYTPKTFIQRIDENNRLNRLNNAVIVFNGVSQRGVGNQGYGYGYGYVYDNDHTQKRLSAG